VKANAWTEGKLGSSIQVKHGFAFLGEYFGSAGTHIVLTPGNFKEEGGFTENAEKRKWYRGPIPKEYVLSAGDVIVAMTEQAEGLLGSSAIVPRSGLYLHNQRLGLIQVLDQKKTDKGFFYYLFNSKPVRQQIRASASGTKIRHTAPSRIEDVIVRVPPLPLQRRIAGILSAYDALIENNERRLRILERMARALYREWFVDFRFPGREKVGRMPSAVGGIPRGWAVARLDDVAQVNRAQLGGDNIPEEIYYIDIASVSPGRINTLTRYRSDEAPGRARRIVRHGDVIWSSVRPNRRSYALIIHPKRNTIASTGFAVLTASRIPFTFLYFGTTTDQFVTYLTNNATGSAYPAVTAATFEKAELIIPPVHLLAQFDKITLPVVEEIEVLNRQITNLSRTRDLLLPRLLTGAIKLRAN